MKRSGFLKNAILCTLIALLSFSLLFIMRSYRAEQLRNAQALKIASEQDIENSFAGGGEEIQRKSMKEPPEENPAADAEEESTVKEESALSDAGEKAAADEEGAGKNAAGEGVSSEAEDSQAEAAEKEEAGSVDKKKTRKTQAAQEGAAVSSPEGEETAGAADVQDTAKSGSENIETAVEAAAPGAAETSAETADPAGAGAAAEPADPKDAGAAAEPGAAETSANAADPEGADPGTSQTAADTQAPSAEPQEGATEGQASSAEAQKEESASKASSADKAGAAADQAPVYSLSISCRGESWAPDGEDKAKGWPARLMALINEKEPTAMVTDYTWDMANSLSQMRLAGVPEDTVNDYIYRHYDRGLDSDRELGVNDGLDARLTERDDCDALPIICIGFYGGYGASRIELIEQEALILNTYNLEAPYAGERTYDDGLEDIGGKYLILGHLPNGYSEAEEFDETLTEAWGDHYVSLNYIESDVFSEAFRDEVARLVYEKLKDMNYL